MKRVIGSIDDIEIAPGKSIADWKLLSSELKLNYGPDVPDLWKQAFTEYLEGRLLSRYLKPVNDLRRCDTFKGEGFSIAAILCSLIEFLETTRQGTYFSLTKSADPEIRKYEYGLGESKKLFVNFLMRKELSGHLSKVQAGDFYSGVRCGLLHEARTSTDWLIEAAGPSGSFTDSTKTPKILYRNNFQTSLTEYIQSYGTALCSDNGNCDIQRAFVRKFDSLCR